MIWYIIRVNGRDYAVTADTLDEAVRVATVHEASRLGVSSIGRSVELARWGNNEVRETP